ncbi:hypothetical protein SERLA73DRAFT_136013 [Serpula lacrymans var. lacrymans S7.3]|uniref:Uncharacterized protein n=2 Tax=Serpula lacrymans var. lacrymans TaxID=341189 RepID=F8PW83_SERL3|nr:uncharacterized protein SERLADRAFT_388329 [Serpula lacrymans var. lacrymans S7.9]EGO00259.1 hypothetical protein SERLA73DRAFT_136013 [Serpula lacrymans var. lacrymans S7.3]EGO25813.1 hypothetical protein SERLADRAFT_388329 [Serpula lacrymans var. lacrymans S7.9]
MDMATRELEGVVSLSKKQSAKNCGHTQITGAVDGGHQALTLKARSRGEAPLHSQYLLR